MSESVPSSVTEFAHQRPRSGSVASFTYLQEGDESPDWSEDQPLVDQVREDMDVGHEHQLDADYELGSGSSLPHRRMSSGISSASVRESLLYRHDSAKTDASDSGRVEKTSQMVYIVTEDLTIVIAGFVTQPVGLMIYIFLCIISLGLGYLILRWLPNWRVRLIGSPSPLRDCEWVVIEVKPLSCYR